MVVSILDVDMKLYLLLQYMGPSLIRRNLWTKDNEHNSYQVKSNCILHVFLEVVATTFIQLDNYKMESVIEVSNVLNRKIISLH